MAKRAPKRTDEQPKKPPYHNGERDEPVSLHPLPFEDALQALLGVRPKPPKGD